MADTGGGYRPQVAETHTGLVVLVGDLAYKTKKPVVTDFLDFSSAASRERACADYKKACDLGDCDFFKSYKAEGNCR